MKIREMSAESKDEHIVAFYFVCPKCLFTFHGKSIEKLPGEMEFKKYPIVCPICDLPLTPEIKVCSQKRGGDIE